MAKAYVTQVPNRRDKETGALVPAVNIGPATEHGELITMMPPTANFFATGDLIKQLEHHLKNYSYEDGDVLIAIGDPIIIGVACSFLARRFSKFTVCRWDRQIQRYLKVVVNMEGV